MQPEGTPLVILAGRNYGAGSSRDWAAKGLRLFGVVAVIAESFERIHRSNLVGMGVLPIGLAEGTTRHALALGREDAINIDLPEGLAIRAPVTLSVRRTDGSVDSFSAVLDATAQIELEMIRCGGHSSHHPRKDPDGMIAPRAPGIERRDVATATGRVAWHLAGSGRPLLLVHGGTGSWTHWLRAIPELARGYQLLMPDLPGFGDSDLPPGPPDRRFWRPLFGRRSTSCCRPSRVCR